MSSHGGKGCRRSLLEREKEMAEKRNKEKEGAGRRFIANMKMPSFVVDMLRGAGVNKAPCFCCLHQVQGTCQHSVGEFDCKDYVLYSRSSEKVEHKLLGYINDVHQQKDWRRTKLAA